MLRDFSISLVSSLIFYKWYADSERSDPFVHSFSLKRAKEPAISYFSSLQLVLHACGGRKRSIV